MDPRQFYKHPSSASSSSTSAPDSSSSSSLVSLPSSLPPFSPEEAERCVYSSYYSSSCINGECSTEKKKFRVCPNREREVLVEENGSKHWERAGEDNETPLIEPIASVLFSPFESFASSSSSSTAFPVPSIASLIERQSEIVADLLSAPFTEPRIIKRREKKGQQDSDFNDKEATSPLSPAVPSSLPSSSTFPTSASPSSSTSYPPIISINKEAISMRLHDFASRFFGSNPKKNEKDNDDNDFRDE